MILAILFFLVFSCGVFFLPNWLWLTVASAFDVILWLISAKNIKKMLKTTLKLSIFVIFVFLMNLIFDDVISCLIIAWKIMIVICFVVSFSTFFSPTLLAKGFSELLLPLKIFGVDTEALSLSIVLALSFIPILAGSAKMLKNSLKARGLKFNLLTILSKGHIIMLAYFSEMFRRVDKVELAFRARGYTGEKQK